MFCRSYIRLKGDDGVIDEYIRLYGKRLYGLCRALCPDVWEADDLYQETWLKVVKKIGHYDTSKPFEPWLTRICVNTYKDLLRRKKLNPVTDPFTSAEEKDAALANVPAVQEEDRSDIRAAVDALPTKLRTTVILFYFCDLGEQQTADALKIPVGTVKSRLNRAKKMLKEELRHEYGLPV